MSDLSMDFQPRTEEPSKARPSSNKFAVQAGGWNGKVLQGTEHVAKHDVDVFDIVFTGELNGRLNAHRTILKKWLLWGEVVNGGMKN